ncbi:Protein of unknown function DUF4598 [Trinorchestia longiramus]|nr:Protein of unknown function DUF4598 [Trinorchestia longiramus]
MTNTTDKKMKNTFLETSGDGSREAVVQSLLSKRNVVNHAEKPKICRVERSPLLAKLQSFIPTLEESNNQLEKMSDNELAKKNMEDVGESEERVINLSVVQADDMQDSPVFKALCLSQNLKSEEILQALTSMSQSDDSSSDSQTDDEDENIISEVISNNRR